MKFNRVLVDTGFLFGIFHKADPFHGMAIDVLQGLRDRRRKLVLAWPVLYETVNTRFLKDGHISEFERFLGRPDTELIDDKPYRKSAYDLICDDPRRFEMSGLSLVDQMLCLMMKHSDDSRIGGLVTFDSVLGAWGSRHKIEVLLPSDGSSHHEKSRLLGRHGARVRKSQRDHSR